MCVELSRDAFLDNGIDMRRILPGRAGLLEVGRIRRLLPIIAVFDPVVAAGLIRN